MAIATTTNEYIKIWRDEGDLRVAFFNENTGVRVEEVPVEDLNSSEPEDIAVEMAAAHNRPVRAGHGVELE